MTRQHRESGVSIVEVVIAAMLLATVVAAVAMASLGGTALRGAARLQTSMTSAGEAAQEDIASDRRWMQFDECKRLNDECDISSAVDRGSLRLEDVEGVAELISARSTALDSDLDNDASGNDLDGVLPDYFRIVVTLRPERSVRARYRIAGTQGVRRFVTTLDRRGVEQIGSVAVEICRVTNQADERMQLQGCAKGRRSDVSMDRCPERTPVCTPAFDWVSRFGASDHSPAPFVSLVRENMSFSLVNASTGKSYPSSGATRVDGLYVFENVPAGEFRLLGLPASAGGNTERWKTKEIPSFHGSAADRVPNPTLNVEPGVRARALVLFRPRTTTTGIDYEFERRTHTFRLTGLYTKNETNVPKMAPTDTYVGSSAEEACAQLARAGGGFKSGKYAQETYACYKMQPGPANCVTLLMRGTFFKRVTPGTGDYIDASDGFGAAALSVADMNAQQTELGTPETMQETRTRTGASLRLATIPTGTPGGRFCTYYAEFYKHYYFAKPTKTPKIRDGAVVGATYMVQPMPIARHLEFDSAGGFEEIATCIGKSRAQCQAPVPGFPAMKAGLKPGLNSKVQWNEPPTTVLKNENLVRAPAWTRAPMWVEPDGDIIPSAGGRVPAGPTVRVRGEGECYWTGWGISGELESASCDPCDVKWKTGRQYRDACSLLVRTDWRRPAWETIRNYGWYDGTGWAATAGEYEIEEKNGTINYDPPWGCTSSAPIMVGGGTCRSGSSGSGGGGNPYIERTDHKDSSGGHGVVLRRRVGSRS
ncbi:MAG: hypothetical protein JWM86_2005 [Thermoleophilia bacterium]|nr:hypothetical protein [Thermoleophilia bacterium]